MTGPVPNARAMTGRLPTRPVSARRTRSVPAGVTLVELMVALALFSVLLATSLGFYRRQGAAFTEGNSRMTVMQNLRYGVNVLEQDLRTAGVGVPAKQPVLVYAGPDVIAFNADYATNLDDDVFAVYHDPRLPAAAVSALTPDRRIRIPRTDFAYPDSAYYAGSGNSPAETLIFFFEPDSSTARADDWALYRQVNDLEPEIVARRLLRTERDFFTYYMLDSLSAGSPIAELPSGYLPAAHRVPIHGSPADTGRALAGIDSIAAVRVSYAATDGLHPADAAVREITRLIPLPNAGLETQRSCGDKPILGSSLLLTPVAATETEPGHIRLEWARATDEYTGERDVLRYVIWRRVGASGPWGDPLTSVAAGASSYLYQDFAAEPDVEYSYAIAAQDCTPQYSPMATAGPVSWTGP